MNPAYRDDEGMKRILETVDKTFSPAEIEKINKAYEFACAAHDGQKRLSGDPYITHPVEVALILAKLGMDADSIAAALLHDTVEDTSVTLQSISEQFGAETAKLVDGVTKLGKIPLATKEEEQAENIRKMLMAMSNEIRVIIIKLADRLHNMRTLKHVAPQKRRDKSLETLEIYAPIAHRLGIRTIKDELEDLAISYLDPVAYGEIEESLAAQSRTRKEFLEDIKAQIRQRVTALIPDATVEGRIKSVHGIYRKMYMQNRDFD